jgi:hypothetical protein
MNYYEELGIRSDADEEEIRKAHRRLVKLMHPDQHRDEGLKALAETQMRRLNSIVATLLDPEERQEYDETLRGGGGDAGNTTPAQSNWRALPWWIASTLGAIILTVGTLWFFADRMGPSRRQQPPPEITESTTPSSTPAPASVPPPTKQDAEPVKQQPDDVTVAKVEVPPALPPPASAPPVKSPEIEKPTATKRPEIKPELKPVVKPDIRPAVKRPEAKIEQATKRPRTEMGRLSPSRVTKIPGAPTKVFIAPTIGTVSVPAKSDSTTTLARLNPPSPNGMLMGGVDIPRTDYNPPPPPVPIVRKKNDPLEGEWVYAPTEPEKRRPGLYPPEFIQLKLVKDTSGLHGEYSARYNVDKTVSPDVNFVLAASDPTGLRYNWTAANGAHGWLNIKDLDSDTMRLEWKETSKHGGQSLSQGVATLVRKN